MALKRILTASFLLIMFTIIPTNNGVRTLFNNLFIVNVCAETENQEQELVLLTVSDNVNVVYSDDSLGNIVSGTDNNILINKPIICTSNRYFYIRSGDNLFKATKDSDTGLYRLFLNDGLTQSGIVYEQELSVGDYFRIGDNVTLRAYTYIRNGDELSLYNKQTGWANSPNGLSPERPVSHKLCTDRLYESSTDRYIFFEDTNEIVILGKAGGPIGVYVKGGTGSYEDPYYFGHNQIYVVHNKEYVNSDLVKIGYLSNGDQITNHNQDIYADILLEDPSNANSGRICTCSYPFSISYYIINGNGIKCEFTVVSEKQGDKYSVLLPYNYNGFLTHIEPISAYTIDYDGNGNTGGTAPYDSNMYDEGAIVTVIEDIGNLEKTGYSFECWNTAPDGSGVDYPGGSEINISSNITLYAKWVAIDYNIIKNAEHGTIKATIDDSEVTKAHYNDTVTLSFNPDDGYFLSSFTVKDINNVPVSVVNNEFSMPSSDVTIAAVFEKTKATIIVENGVIHDIPTDSTTSDINVTVEKGELVAVEAQAELDGQVFAGWQINGIIVNYSRIYMFTATDDVTVTAVYSETEPIYDNAKVDITYSYERVINPTNTAKDQIKLRSNYSVNGTRYYFVRAGYLYTTGERSAYELENPADGVNVRDKYYTGDYFNIYYNLTIGVASTNVWTVMPYYVTYDTESGAEQTVYLEDRLVVLDTITR